MTKTEWWWEFNREHINIAFEDDEGEDVSQMPMFSDGNEDLPDDEDFTVSVDDLEYFVKIDEEAGQIEVASDEAFTITVSKDVAYIFGFLSGLRTPVTLPESIKDNLQALVSACLGDYKKLEALSGTAKQDLIQALSVISRKVRPLADDLAPQPTMKVILGGDEETEPKSESQDEDSSQDWEALRNQISKAIGNNE